VADGGYPTVLLLDGWLLLSRPGMRAAEEALRRWLNAAALARPAGEGGRVVVLAEAELPVVQALVGSDPARHADREPADRSALRFRPAVRLATLTGVPLAVQEFLAEARLPDGADVLGPVSVDDEHERVLIRVPRQLGNALSAALKAASAERTSRKAADTV